LANGLQEPGMTKKKMCGIAVVFAGFQALMPMVGWICVHTIVQHFTEFQTYVPWIALILLLFIGGKMLLEGIQKKETQESRKLGIGALLVQGIATSIDALSVGFTISEYGFTMAVVCALIIAMVTFVICMAGVVLGKKFGTGLSDQATIIGGVILIAIGIEIFITSWRG